MRVPKEMEARPVCAQLSRLSLDSRTLNTKSDYEQPLETSVVNQNVFDLSSNRDATLGCRAWLVGPVLMLSPLYLRVVHQLFQGVHI